MGAEAQTFARERVVAILDKQRYADPSFVALARAALKAVAPERIEVIMTGMPTAWFADKAAQEHLRLALAHAAALWGTPSITIAPEAAGVYYRYVFETGRLDLQRTRGRGGRNRRWLPRRERGPCLMGAAMSRARASPAARWRRCGRSSG